MDRHKGLQIPVTGHVEQEASPIVPFSDDVTTKSEQNRTESRQNPDFANSKTTYLNSPFRSKAISEPEIQRQSLSDYIDRHFQDYGSAHGAIDSRVLLWGREGDGKRQFASRYAINIASRRHRQLLWIEASLSHTFIRDYRLAYQVMTREMPPTGTNLIGLLYLMQKRLSECREKWFMVVLDLGNRLTRPTSNEAGFDLVSYLPKGQILITHSKALSFGHRKQWQVEDCPDLELQSSTVSIRWGSASYDDTSKFLNIISPYANIGADMTKKMLRGAKDHLITLIVICATSLLRGIPVTHCSRLLQQTLVESNQDEAMMPKQQFAYFVFSIAMKLFMEALRDVNKLAEAFLAIVTVVSYRDVPIGILQRMRSFDEIPNQLENVLELLSSCCIIIIRTAANGERFIDMNPQIHAWLDIEFRSHWWDGDDGFEMIVSEWVDTIDAILPEVNEDTEGYQYWSLLHLIVPLLSISRESDVRTKSLVSFLRKTCTFLGEHLIMPLVSARLLARAQQLRMEMADCLDDNEQQAIVLHRECSKMSFLLGNIVLAQKELFAAYKLLSTAKLDDSEKAKLQESIFDERISQSLQQGDLGETAMWLRRALSEDTTKISEARLARLHHWVSCAAPNDPDGNVFSLQHSHIAMSYWSKLPESQKWGFQHFPQLAWVDTHAGYLMQLDKSRGALVFLPKIFKRHIEQCPAYNENIWRLAFCLVREHSLVGEMDAAEEVAYQALSRVDHNLLRGAPLTWAIMMMRSLASALYRSGRYLESEGAFRWCLDCLEHRSPPTIVGQSGTKFTCLIIWSELVQTLVVQEKLQQAQAAVDLSIQRGYDGLKYLPWVIVRASHVSLSQQYDSALQAARDRIETQYNAEDWKLDLGRPGSFHLPVKIFGDPFERLQDGNEDFRSDIYPSQGYCRFQDSKILPLIGYNSPKSERSNTDPLWETVFQSILLPYNVHTQTPLTKYFSWCDCRRKRPRAFSSGCDDWWNSDSESGKESHSRSSKLSYNQTLITRYMVCPPTYSKTVCQEDCPCIAANVSGKIITDQIVREKLFLYQPSSPGVVELEQQYYLEDLKKYRRSYGPRPALPYGLGVYSNWRIPDYVAETNGDAALQHELFWAPDFVLRGDTAALSEFYGQEENYIMTNPALTTMGNSKIPTFDLPNIRITAHKLGEEVKANIDKLTNPWRKNWTQRKITKYFPYIGSRKRFKVRRRRSSTITEGISDLIDSNRTKQKRHRHKSKSVNRETKFNDKKQLTTSSYQEDEPDMKNETDETTIGTKDITDTDRTACRKPGDQEASSSGRRTDISLGNQPPDRDESRSPSTNSYLGSEVGRIEVERIIIRPRKLHIFNIDSIHSSGSIFDPGLFSKRRLNRMRAMMARHAGRLDEIDHDSILGFSDTSINEQDEDDDDDKTGQDENQRPQNLTLDQDHDHDHGSSSNHENFMTSFGEETDFMDSHHHIPHRLEDIIEEEGEEDDEPINSNNDKDQSLESSPPETKDETVSHNHSILNQTTNMLVFEGEDEEKGDEYRGKGKSREINTSDPDLDIP